MSQEPIYLQTKQRQIAQTQLIALMRARKQWDQSTKRGKEAMQSVVNAVLLLGQLGGDWGALSGFNQLPELVAAKVLRRAQEAQKLLATEFTDLCTYFSAMREAELRLRQLNRDICSRSADPSPFIHAVLTLECAASRADTMVAMFEKELIAKQMILHEMSRDPGIDGSGWKVKPTGDGSDSDSDDEASGKTSITRDLAEVYIASWMLQPLLDLDELDVTMSAFQHEIEDIGALTSSPMRQSPARRQ